MTPESVNSLSSWSTKDGVSVLAFDGLKKSTDMPCGRDIVVRSPTTIGVIVSPKRPRLVAWVEAKFGNRQGVLGCSARQHRSDSQGPPRYFQHERADVNALPARPALDLLDRSLGQVVRPQDIYEREFHLLLLHSVFYLRLHRDIVNGFT